MKALSCVLIALVLPMALTLIGYLTEERMR
jgi:hypothetical protein